MQSFHNGCNEVIRKNSNYTMKDLAKANFNASKRFCIAFHLMLFILSGRNIKIIIKCSRNSYVTVINYNTESFL